jgi:hypothetical protein
VADVDASVGGAEGKPEQGIFLGPTLVRAADATRFLWGDEASGQVADLIYGRG